MPRIAIAGLGIEYSTFSPARTTEEAFHAQQGMEIMDHYPFLKPESRNRAKAP
jgi:microcystin degradation protein MlrC